MSKTIKHTIKAMKKASRENLPLPQNQIIPDKKKSYKRKPKNRKALNDGY